MSIPQDNLFESALSLPQAERAELAFQLLQSLTPPSKEISSEELAAELNDRLAAYHRGEIDSYSLDETRAIIRERLSEGPTS
jgi:putative addiction module component (TIGR02574 family)